MHKRSLAIKNGNKLGTIPCPNKRSPFLAACILDSEKNIKNTKNIENRIVKKYFFTENIRNLYFNLITYKILFIKLENND